MSAGPEGLVAHYFRHESGRLVAALARKFRLLHLEDAEDAVQEALMVALTAAGMVLLDRLYGLDKVLVGERT